MKDNIFALLTAVFAGVRKDGLNQLARILALQAATDDEAKALVDKLTKAQVDEFVKEFRAEVDKEVSDSNKTAETNLRKKYDFVDKQKVEKPDEKGDGSKKDDGETPAWAKSIIEGNEMMRKELAILKSADVAKTRLQSLNEKLNGCKDETFKALTIKNFNRMKFETDDEFTEYLTDTEKDIATANQNAANLTLGGNGRPMMPNVTPDGKQHASKEELEAVMGKLPI